MITKTHTNPRSIILIALWGMMLMSLAYSMSVQYGHADAPIADAAEQTMPLGAGDMAPRFIVQSMAGETFDFDPRDLQRPAIIITFRGGWCPFCNTHLSELRHVIPEISQMGIDVLFLSGDRPELLFESLRAETQEDIASLDYLIYSDAEAHAAIALGIAFRPSETTLNRRNEKGDDIEGSSMRNHDVLAVPAVFAIDTDGLISFAYANPNYRIRLPADELLEVAKSMASRAP